MKYSKSIDELVRLRYSCRSYQKSPIPEDMVERLKLEAKSINNGIFGAKVRMEIIAARDTDRDEMRGLGTYGGVQNPMGFIAGAVQTGDKDLEDFGYMMEKLVLLATDLGLGTCWLGGSFNQSSFAKRINLAGEEILPAVISLGIPHPTEEQRASNPGRFGNRLKWSDLYFENGFSQPLSSEAAGKYAVPLELIRLAPSASNKQPWRILKQGEHWHLYLKRTPGYQDDFLKKLMKVKDLQRVDMGIAMCHFELAAHEQGISGQWSDQYGKDVLKADGLSYVATWAEI